MVSTASGPLSKSGPQINANLEKIEPPFRVLAPYDNVHRTCSARYWRSFSSANGDIIISGYRIYWNLAKTNLRFESKRAPNAPENLCVPIPLLGGAIYSVRRNLRYGSPLPTAPYSMRPAHVSEYHLVPPYTCKGAF